MSTIEIDTQLAQAKDLATFKDSLVGGSIKPAMKAGNATSSDLWRVPRAAIRIRKGYNPRIRTAEFEAGLDELARSIAENGFYADKPIGVTIAKEDGKDVIYIEDGHRRFEASEIAVNKYGATLDTLPCVTLASSLSPEKRLAHMVHSNQDGVKFTPLELSVVVARMESMGLDVDAISALLRMTPTRVKQLQVLSSSPAEVRKLVETGEISATLAIETTQQSGAEAPALLKEAVKVAKETGKKATGKTVKAVKAKKGKPTIKELSSKAERLQKKHGAEAFDLLKRIMDKHGKHVDSEFHVLTDALFVKCGVI